MRLKDSNQTRVLGLILAAMGGINLVLSIYYVIMGSTDRFLSLLVSSLLWGACGLLVLNTAKKQLKEEDEKSKQKTSAYNYGKKKKRK